MQKKEEEEDVWNREIDVEDGNNALKGIFKSDYERIRELERISIYMSAEWTQIVRLLKKRLRHEGEMRQGAHFIRRRLTVTGLQLLNEDNATTISKRQEKYDNDLETFNPLSCILAAQPHNIYQHEQIRRSLFLKEETLGWIQDLADMFNLNTYSVVRVAWCYTILELIRLEYLPGVLTERTKQDIEIFKEYISLK